MVAKEYGFSRVILARETPISEIKKITKIIETEVFIQGALCTSFSGHCYMSGYAGGNSGN
ncbi:MAG: U32 family peptidase, partial [Clostridia bacterium]|nr:U32 family peptidase [Clostridia bacterium]